MKLLWIGYARIYFVAWHNSDLAAAPWKIDRGSDDPVAIYFTHCDFSCADGQYHSDLNLITHPRAWVEYPHVHVWQHDDGTISLRS